VRDRKVLGLLIMVLGAVGFFFSLKFFGLVNAVIEHNNFSFMLRIAASSAIPVLGLYFGLYYYSNKRTAVQIAGGLAVSLAVLYLIGFLTH
jgi:hypothetical protein